MIQLMHGDCLELMKQIPDKSIDLVITDPPYQFGTIRGSGMFSQNNYEKYGRKYNIGFLKDLEKLDSVTFNPVVILDILEAKLKSFYGYFFCNKMLLADYINWAKKKNYSYDVLVMAKTNPIPAHSTHHVADLEYIVLIRGKKTFFQGKGLNLDCYRKWFQTNCQKKMHPAEKPLELVKRFVNISCQEEGVILDCFMGSGTTGVACVNTNRSFIGIEKDDHYFEVAKKRINDAQKDRETMLFKEVI